jgi:putative transposase
MPPTSNEHQVARNPLHRFYGQNHLHFITFSAYRRRPVLGTPRARDTFVKILDQVRNRYDFKLLGYVVMPEHVHLILSEPPAVTPSIVLQVLKQKVSATLHSTWKRPPAIALTGIRKAAVASPTWERRFYDFNIWSSDKLNEKLAYVHANPVKNKLVVHPKDWPWSSWSQSTNGERGLIHIDSLG